MKVLDYVLRLSDPRNVIACYTIFLVVRAVEAEDSQTDDVLLLSQICPDHIACDLTLNHATDIFSDFVLMDEDTPPPWIDDSVLKGLLYVFYKKFPLRSADNLLPCINSFFYIKRINCLT